MSTGQNDQNPALNNTETLTIGNNAQPQSQYPDHPRKIYGATGGFLNKKFVTCGGENYFEEGYSDKCYKLGSEGSFATMMMERSYAASIVLEDEKLWILGGWDVNSYNLYSSKTVWMPTSLYSTEYVFTDGRNEEGPPMPIGLNSHKIVKINETTSFLVGGFTGGWTGDYSKRTWYYNGKWIEGPDLEKVRSGHSLGIVRDYATLQEYVVAAGGIGGSGAYYGSYLNDVEILGVQENKWEPGKLL